MNFELKKNCVLYTIGKPKKLKKEVSMMTRTEGRYRPKMRKDVKSWGSIDPLNRLDHFIS